MTRVEWGGFVEKQLERVPDAIRRKFRYWVDVVEEDGIREARKRPGLHDEPLKGKRAGQQSVRLNAAWRAFYVEHDGGLVELIEVVEVNKHEY